MWRRLSRQRASPCVAVTLLVARRGCSTSTASNAASPSSAFVDVAGASLDTAVEWVLHDFVARQQRQEHDKLAKYNTTTPPHLSRRLANTWLYACYCNAWSYTRLVTLTTCEPTGLYHVTPMFAHALLCAEAVEARLMWRAYYLAHFCDTPLRVDAAASARVLDVPNANIYWVYNTFAHVVHYALWRSGGDAHATQCNDDDDDDGMQAAGAHAGCASSSSACWLPHRLLYYMPFFPLPPHVVRRYTQRSGDGDAARPDGDSSFGLPHCAYPFGGRGGGVVQRDGGAGGHEWCGGATRPRQGLCGGMSSSGASYTTLPPISKYWTTSMMTTTTTIDITARLTAPYYFDFAAYALLWRLRRSSWWSRQRRVYRCRQGQTLDMPRKHTSCRVAPAPWRRSDTDDRAGRSGYNDGNHHHEMDDQHNDDEDDDDDDAHEYVAGDDGGVMREPGKMTTPLHCTRALQHRGALVRVCGQGYVNASSTWLACLLDSATCVCHSIPLTEDGGIFFDAMDTLRLRTQRCAASSYNVDAVAPRAAASAAAAATSTTTTAVTNTAAPSPTPSMPHASSSPAADMWMRRIQALQRATTAAAAVTGDATTTNTQTTTATAAAAIRPYSRHVTSPMERFIDMHTLAHQVDGRYRSPYWVDVATLRERWGVDVACGVVPACVHGRLYVNADETTDASRFGVATCNARMQHQQVLSHAGLHTCSWQVSRMLRTRLAQAYGCDDADSRGSGGGGNAAATTEPLNCNLWVTSDLVDEAGWTLAAAAATTTTMTSTVAFASTHGRAAPGVVVVDVDATLLACASSSSPTQHHDNGCRRERLPHGAAATRATVTLVHACSIAQREELTALLGYSPLIYLDKMDELCDGDVEYVTWCKLCSARRMHYASTCRRQWHERRCPSSTAAPHTRDENGHDDDDSNDNDNDGDLSHAQAAPHVVALRRCAVLPHCAYARACAAFCARLRYTPVDGDGACEQLLCDAYTTPFDHMYYCNVYRRLHAQKMRRCNAWRACCLPFAHRLRLALHALSRRYAAAHRDVWVTTSFLAKERAVTLRTRDTAAVCVSVAERNARSPATTAAAAAAWPHGGDGSTRAQSPTTTVRLCSFSSSSSSSSFDTLELVNRAELHWDDDNGDDDNDDDAAAAACMRRLLWISQRF